ncbi:MAG: hypothetical protein HYX67_16405 [Candidatus Melainabacteria bacterium]|nr:hypothetical protein [Candidatus Melainabacteria bacterium]
MHEDEKYHNVLLAWMPELNSLANLQIEIGLALSALSEKRVTLEEKMIRRHLHQLSGLFGRVTEEAHQMLASHYDANTDTTLDELRTLSIEVQNVVADLLKIIRYNLNFLEQYYEYDYYSRLQNDHKFVDRTQKIVDDLVRRRS